MLVELCAAPNGSYSLSLRLGEAAQAPALADRADAVAAAGDDLVRIGTGGRRPRPACRRACRTHNGSRRSARPRRGPEPRCPPDCDTAEIISARSSSASCGSCALSSARMSAGNWTVSSSGVSGRSDMAAGLSHLRRRCRPISPISAITQKCSGTQSPQLPRTSITGRLAAKPALFGRLADPAVTAVVVDMRRLPAIVADQEDAVVQAAGMLVGDIGVGAFDPPREVGADEQVEDPVDAVGGDPPPLRLRHRLGDVIGARPAGRSRPARRTPPRACRSTARRAAVSRRCAASRSDSPW